jgi:hypothetical protein
LNDEYWYPFASEIASVARQPQLALAASSSPIAERLFFAGDLRKPEIAVGLLLATSEVALRRYYVPPSMLARILRAADPVVTAANRMLRFEAFLAKLRRLRPRRSLARHAVSGDLRQGYDKC